MGFKSVLRQHLSPQNFERARRIRQWLLKPMHSSTSHNPASAGVSPAPSAPTASTAPVTLSQMREALGAAGLKRGDVVLVHSSANTLIKSGSLERRDDATPTGVVQYSAAVIDMLLDYLGPDGTLLMPTEGMGDVQEFSRNGKVFDSTKVPSNRGLITELFRRRSGVVRSVHPWYNLAGCGPLAAELIKDHAKAAPYTMDSNSPWHKLNDVGGKVVMLGTGFDCNSLIHLPEYVYGQEYPRAIYYNRFFPLKYRDVDGSVQSMDVAIHIPNWRSGEVTRFCRHLQEKYAIYRIVPLGTADLICYDAVAQYDALCREMHANVCWYDVRHWN